MKTYLTRSIAPANLFVTLACGLWGIATMVAIISPRDFLEVPWFVIAAAIGATLAGFVTAQLFGTPGRRGWLLALVGGLLATSLGAGIGGGMVFGPEWAGVAAFMVPVMIVDRLWRTVLWLACVAALHAATMRARRRWP